MDNVWLRSSIDGLLEAAARAEYDGWHREHSLLVKSRNRYEALGGNSFAFSLYREKIIHRSEFALMRVLTHLAGGCRSREFFGIIS
jgi:hypothetical protein